MKHKRQRQAKQGHVSEARKSPLPEETIHRILFERGHPVLAKVAKRKKLDLSTTG